MFKLERTVFDTYEDKLNPFFTRSEELANNYFEKITNRINKFDLKNLNREGIHEKIVNNYSRMFLRFVDRYEQGFNKIADFGRKSTVPINWPYYLYLKLKMKFDSNVLFANGVHFFVALQGGGKSTLAYELIERLRIQSGKGSYVNADFELPQQDPISKEWFQYHNRFTLLDFFDLSIMKDNPEIEVAQLKKFNRYFDSIVLDEWLTEMNHRLNRTKDYNNTFLALITMIAHMRHQKIKRIYVLSQIENTDIQLMSMFKYQHEIEIDLDVSYWNWVKTGMMTKHIQGWHVWTYSTKRNKRKRTNEKYLIKKQYVKRTADFSNFDTYAQASKYAELPEDYIQFL